MQNRILLRAEQEEALVPFQSGVSLHGHTSHSYENLGFIEKFLEGRASTRQWLHHQRKRGKGRTGISVDFGRAYWTPPLGERQAYAVEAEQLEALRLRALISLSDHDSVAGCLALRQDPAFRNVPVSTEWTVPFGKAIFHLGLHNLPPEQSADIMTALQTATRHADDEATLRLLADLNDLPELLIVFNHPLWNFNKIEGALFTETLRRFLLRSNGLLHAFELNGMRDHRENRETVRLAAAWGQVLVAGGDRHGCEPNAMINVTNAANLPEFVAEIREDKQSTILLLPQYSQPLPWRLYRAFTEVIRAYPDHPTGRQFWDQRVFHPDTEGNLVPVIDLWHLGPPGFLKKIFAAAILGAHLPVAPFLRPWSAARSQALLAPAEPSPEAEALHPPKLRSAPGAEVHFSGRK